MYQPVAYPIVAWKGADFGISLTWKDDLGNIFDLRSYTGQLTVSSNKNATDQLLLLSTSNGKMVLSNVSPNIVLSDTQADIAALTFDTAFYKLILTSPGNIATLLLFGSFEIKP